MHSRWTLQDAKNKFSEVVNAACAGAPQVVTKRGKPTVVVLSMRDYERFLEHSKAPVPRFTEFLLSMPAGEEQKETDLRQNIALREVTF
jgi:prevent-host-death family protein